jgi:multicomponent Na+:H+ antiporter subunit E
MVREPLPSASLPRPSSRWIWTLQGFAVLFLLWLVFDGPGDWGAGVLAASCGAALAFWLGRMPQASWKPLRMPGFAGFFLIESLRGGLDVAWRSLHPRLPVRPEFFEYEIGLPQGQPSTLLISVISLLPGTLSAELQRQEHVLVVHSLSPGGHASVQALERQIARLYGFDLPEPRR